jgi:hypothetical protein
MIMAGLIKEISGPFWSIVRPMLRQIEFKIDRAGQFVTIRKGKNCRQISFDQIEAEFEDAKQEQQQ